MKKAKEVTVGKTNVLELAKGLHKTLGHNKAVRLANYYYKTTQELSTSDVNSDISSAKEMEKTRNIWKQVRGILNKTSA